MALASAQIIDAVAARLLGAGITPAGTRVYTSRAWPLAEKDLPAWRVLAGGESIEPQHIQWPHVYEHTLQVDLQGHVRAVADVDDAMHAMAEAALLRLFADRPQAVLGGLRAHMELAGIDREMQADAQAAHGLVAVQLTVKFKTRANAPGVII